MTKDKVPWYIKRSKIYSDPLLRDLISFYYNDNELWQEKSREFKETILKIAHLYKEEVTVNDVLISWGEVKVLDLEATMEEVEAEIKKSKHSRYPVMDREKGTVVGILHVKDLLTRKEILNEKGWQSILRDPKFIPVTMGLFDALKKMRATRSHLLLVIDPASEGLEGIITMEDVIEQVFGEITDEFDQEREKQKYILAKEGSKLYLRGDTPIRVLKEKLNLLVDEELEERVDSLAGLLIANHNFIIPETGEKIEYAGWEFEVTRANSSRIEEVKATPIAVKPG